MTNKKPNTKYLKILTDNFGIWQHSNRGVINKEEGYALDDAARGLIVYLLYKDKLEADVCFKYIERSVKDGKLFGFFNKEQEPIVYPSSEDAFNVTFLALAFCVAQDFNKDEASLLLKRLTPEENNQNIRSLAYLLIAKSYLNLEMESRNIVQILLKTFNEKISWFEDKLYYANALMPYALLVYLNSCSSSLDKNKVCEVILKSINLLEKNMRIGVIPSPVGNRIFLKPGSDVRDVYGQQPIDAAFMVLMHLEAYKYFKDSIYLARAKEWMNWFYGNNIWQKSLVVNDNSCADGLDAHDVSENFGAESTIMFLWAAYSFYNSAK